MPFSEAKTQVLLSRRAFEGDAGAMQPMPLVEDIPTADAIRKLQVQVLHLGNAVGELLDELESTRRRSR